MPERRHDCPGSCGRTVGHRMFACPDCWRALPAHLRDAITTAYANRDASPLAHIRAMAEAKKWYREQITGGRQ